MSQEELEQRHTPQEIRDTRFVYGLMMESMTGYTFAEFCMQQAMSPSDARQELEKYYMPKTIAATYHQKGNVRQSEQGGDPLLFLGRVDQAADQLAMLGCGKSVEVNRQIVNLSSLYNIQSKSILSRQSIPHSEIYEIMRDAYAHDKVQREMVTKALAVKEVGYPHALYAGAAQPDGGGSAGSGGGGRNMRGGRLKGGQEQQQQQQHRHPKQNGGGGGGAAPQGITGPRWRWDAAACRYRWDDSGTNPFGTGGQVPSTE